MNRTPKAEYTKEFRDKAVKLAMTDGVSVSEAARRLSISMRNYCERAHDKTDGHASLIFELSHRTDRHRVQYNTRTVAAKYCAHAYKKLLKQFDMQASISKRGNCFDNAPIESFWGLLKNDLCLSSQVRHQAA
ncbi:transposase [Caballeronia sordidicola]|uniref:transposase n=1 Tax=Caballeronia sordidicola TaxID=196367 RepID=UPI000A3ACC1A